MAAGQADGVDGRTGDGIENEVENEIDGGLDMAATERVRQRWDRHAATYDRGIATERFLIGDARAFLCGQASGEVLEVAIGTGRNLPHYPPGTRLTAIDLSAGMLGQARARAGALGLDVDLRQGDAQALPFPDRSFDSVVCTFALCEIPDLPRAVAEMRRVLRPGGLLLVVDHVRSSNRALLALMRLADRFEPGHLLRRPIEQIRAGGFVIEHESRTRAGVFERVVARAPAA
jgi:ubiquinone/menaquinone biosynthesis C-methylase UbiE